MIPTLRTSCAILAQSRTIQQKVAVPTIHSYVNLAIDAHGDMSMHIQMPATHESNTDGCIIRCLRRIHRMPCRSASYEIVGHIFGTNLGKKPTYYKTLSVIVRSASYELSRSASYEIVGHIFGTNLGKQTDILQDSFRFCHTHRLCSFLVVTVEPWTQNKLLQRMLSYT